MKPITVLALFGIILACIPTSASQIFPNDQMVGRIEAQRCPNMCDEDAGGNIVIILERTIVVVSRINDRRFMYAINLDRQIALYLNLNVRLGALIRLNSGDSIVYEVDNGSAFYTRLTFRDNTKITSSMDAQVLFNICKDLEAQIVTEANRGGMFRFSFFLAVVRIADGEQFGTIFTNPEIRAAIETNLGNILREIGQEVKSEGVNALDVVIALTKYVIIDPSYATFFVHISIRLPARLAEQYVTIFIAAARQGREALALASFDILGAVTALGDVVIGDSRYWTINVDKTVTYFTTHARDALKKFWSLVFVTVGDTSGQLEIGFIRNFIFLFNKKNNWVTTVGPGRYGIYNMVVGTGIVVSDDYVTMVYRSNSIQLKWNYFLGVLDVDTLRAGLSEGYNVTVHTQTERGFRLADFNSEIRARSTSRIPASFLADFQFYAEYLRSNERNTGAGLCFSGFRLPKIEASFISVINRMSSTVKFIDFPNVANQLFDVINRTSRIEEGFSFNVNQTTNH